MEQTYGQNLKKSYLDALNNLNNVKSKIDKKFNLMLNKHSNYISDEHKNLITNNNNMSIERKLDIIIKAEDNYNKKHSIQIDMFD